MVGNKTNRTGTLRKVRSENLFGVGLLDNHVVLVAENELHTTLVHSEDAGDCDGFAALEDLRCDLQVSEF